MTITNIGSGTTTVYANDLDTTYVLKASAHREATGNAAISANSTISGRAFILNGTIEDCNNALFVGFGSSNTNVIIGATAHIDAAERAISIFGDNSSVINGGSIISTSLLGQDVGIGMTGDHLRLTNTGLIDTTIGFDLRGDDFVIQNTGKILTSGGSSVYGDFGDATKVVNRGVISGDVGALITGNSNDTVINFGRFNGYISLDNGDDVFRNKGGVVKGEVRGGDGEDLYFIDKSSLHIVEQAGEGFDRVKSTVSFTLAANVEEGSLLGRANINLTGSAGNDLLYGNSGNNIIFGGLGSDYITGGKGNDILTGTDKFLNGSDLGDIFIFKAHSGQDVITDFQDGLDHINLGTYTGIDSFADLAGHIKQVGDDVVIHLLDGDQITLQGMFKTDVTDADFQF